MSETVQQLLAALAEVDTPGLKTGSEVWSWREVVAEANRRADALLGLADRSRPFHVGVLMENTPEMVLALSAGAVGGYVTAGINTTRRGEGLGRDIRKADCQVLLTDAEHLPLLDGVHLGGARVIDTDSDDWALLLETAEPQARREVSPADTFMLIFTSGTSGDPKAVQVAHFMAVMSGAVLKDKYGLGPSDTCYVSMPLFHSNAVLSGYSVALAGGSAIALAEKFSAHGFLDDIRRYGATYFNYVGKPLAYILATPEKPDDADNPLKFAFGNEAAERDQAEFARRFGCEVWDGFGSTETAVIVTRVEGTPPGSIGQPFDGVAVYDRETRTECPRAVFDEHGKVTNLEACVGELVNTQGAGFFAGYYNDEQATNERLDGGMHWSGDLAYRDADGFVYLAGRTSDWLRVDGENIAAAPVEAILLRHPAVSQAVVYGVPDEHVGDQLMAAVVLTAGGTLEPDDFEAFLDSQRDLSPKARPRYVLVTDHLPSTATNKVLKRELIARGAIALEGETLWEREPRGTAYGVVART